MNKDNVTHRDSRRSFVSVVTIAGAGLVEQVAQREKALGIYDLSKFTPA